MATNLDIVLVYLSRQKPTTHVVVSAGSGQMGISGGSVGGSEYLALGPAYYAAMPAAVRAGFPLRDMPAGLTLPIVTDPRYVGTVAQLAGALKGTLAPIVNATATPAAPSSRFSRTGVVLIAAGLGLAWFLTRRRR